MLVSGACCRLLRFSLSLFRGVSSPLRTAAKVNGQQALRAASDDKLATRSLILMHLANNHLLEGPTLLPVVLWCGI